MLSSQNEIDLKGAILDHLSRVTQNPDEENVSPTEKVQLFVELLEILEQEIPPLIQEAVKDLLLPSEEEYDLNNIKHYIGSVLFPLFDAPDGVLSLATWVPCDDLHGTHHNIFQEARAALGQSPESETFNQFLVKTLDDEGCLGNIGTSKNHYFAVRPDGKNAFTKVCTIAAGCDALRKRTDVKEQAEESSVPSVADGCPSAYAGIGHLSVTTSTVEVHCSQSTDGGDDSGVSFEAAVGVRKNRPKEKPRVNAQGTYVEEAYVKPICTVVLGFILKQCKGHWRIHGQGRVHLEALLAFYKANSKEWAMFCLTREALKALPKQDYIKVPMGESEDPTEEQISISLMLEDVLFSTRPSSSTREAHGDQQQTRLSISATNLDRVCFYLFLVNRTDSQRVVSFVNIPSLCALRDVTWHRDHFMHTMGLIALDCMLHGYRTTWTNITESKLYQTLAQMRLAPMQDKIKQHKTQQ